jgi:membrane-bound lytic murein transglycosylase A
MMTSVPGRGHEKKRMLPVVSATILGALLLASCATPPPPPARPAPPPPPPVAAVPEGPTHSEPTAVMLRPQSRWANVPWSDLPGWESDTVTEWWPAFLRSCEKPGFEWARVCTDARTAPPAMNNDALRAWLRQRLQPWRIESTEGVPEGLITGYFEPLVEASRQPKKGFRVPLYAPPADLGVRNPYWSRQQIDTLSAARASLRGYELAYVADPLDALILQIQGSGRLNLSEPKGTRLVRMAFAAHNEHPYKSVGRWLIDQGELRPEQASWQAIKAWAKKNPKRVNEMLWSNPRTVFFREEPLPDPNLGPKGAQGVPLTPGRSIAVDPQSIPYGSPVWLDTTEPLSSQPLQRVVMAQDTGSAITGAVRADYFWGWSGTAEQQAGRMKQPLRMWVLWPK